MNGKQLEFRPLEEADLPMLRDRSSPPWTALPSATSSGIGRAIRCYEKAGFERIDEITTPDGPALMMCLWRTATR